MHETTDRHGKVRSRVVDNGWVVPHNRFLTLKYDCHINVEVCISVESVKYLYKVSKLRTLEQASFEHACDCRR